MLSGSWDACMSLSLLLMMFRVWQGVFRVFVLTRHLISLLKFRACPHSPHLSITYNPPHLVLHDIWFQIEFGLENGCYIPFDSIAFLEPQTLKMFWSWQPDAQRRGMSANQYYELKNKFGLYEDPFILLPGRYFPPGQSHVWFYFFCLLSALSFPIHAFLVMCHQLDALFYRIIFDFLEHFSIITITALQQEQSYNQHSVATTTVNQPAQHCILTTILPKCS